jgi:meiosis induction protein kinase IME2/SME1
MGAMAIEVATLRPIFPGTNEIDQLWRVCEVMGTPAEWSTTDERTGKRVRIGGGSWSAGLKLAGSLSFKFPHVHPFKNLLIQVPPMDMTTILTPPWPKCLSEFVVACLSWDPKKRPTSTQCLNHEYFKDVERFLPQRDPVPGMFPCFL